MLTVRPAPGRFVNERPAGRPRAWLTERCKPGRARDKEKRPPPQAVSSLCRALVAPVQETEKSADFWSFCSPFSLSMMTSTLYLPFGQPEGGGEKV